MSTTPSSKKMLHALRAKFSHNPKHTFTNAQISERAFAIWQQRSATGLSGTSEEDWQQAITVLKEEQRISAKAYHLWEARQQKLRESDKRTATDDWRDAKASLKQTRWTQFTRWTGIREKKGWDFVQLLASISIPVVLFVGGTSFTYWNNQQQQKIAESKQKDDVLKNYFDNMKSLLLDKDHPLKKKDEQESRSIARTLTLTTLRQLNIAPERDSVEERKGLVIQFLWESDLIAEDEAIVNLYGADLRGADLRSVDLRGANLRGVDLSGANLRGTSFSGADLSGAKLSGADLSHAYLTVVDLSDVDLSDAVLSNAVLSDANLRGANLRGANLSGTNLIAANLSESDLSHVQGVTSERLRAAILCHTRMPDYTQSDRDCKAQH